MIEDGSVEQLFYHWALSSAPPQGSRTFPENMSVLPVMVPGLL